MQNRQGAGRGTARELRQAIAAKPPGSVFTTRDLLLESGLGGSRSALDVALKRLVDEGAIARAGRGVFYIPKEHRLIGKLSPTPNQLAEALARRDGATLLPAGPSAANQLGLTTQVVAKPIFLTTGRARRRRVGNVDVELRPRSPRRTAEDPVLAHTIEALRFIGKKQAASDKTVEHLRRIFNDEQRARIGEQLHLAPAWMWPILRRVAA
ncbi:MAG: DUF6088 family protein [Candidatus Dormibacteria bacterium]